MTKISILLSGLALALLAGCTPDKPSTTGPAPGAETAPSSETAQPAEQAPRAATFNPDLKVEDVEWESPEKEKAWRERQAAIKAKVAAQQAQKQKQTAN